jgi:hypothetical protein
MNAFARCRIAPFAHGGLLFGVVFSFPVSFSEVVMKLGGSWFGMAGQERHGLVQVEGLGFFKEHRHSSLRDSGNRVLFPDVVRFKLGGCFNSGGGRLGARACRGHPFADFPQENSAAEEFMRMGCHREAAPLHPVATFCRPCPVRSLGPRVDTPYFQPDSSNPFHFVIL